MAGPFAGTKLNKNVCCALLAGTMLSAIASAPPSVAADDVGSGESAILLAQAVVNPNDPRQKAKAPPPKGQPPAAIQRGPAPPVQPKSVQAPLPPQVAPPAQPKGLQAQPPARPAPAPQRQFGQPKTAPAVPPPAGAPPQPAQAQPPQPGLLKGPQPAQARPQPGLPKGPVQTRQTPPVQPGAPAQPVIGKPAPATPAPLQQAKPPQPTDAPAPSAIGRPAPGTPGVPPAQPVIGKPALVAPAAPTPPQGTAAINPRAGRVEVLRTGRVEHTEPGGRVVIQEPGGRVIVRESGRVVIRHDETERFRLLGHDHRIEQRGVERFAYVARPGGYQIITVTGPDGRMLRRIRRGPDGREVVLVNNAVVGAAVATGFILALAAPQILIPREQYIVNVAAAPPALLYETLDAPPVVPIERAYALDEIRYNVNLRDRVRRLDLDAITFDTGSWEITPEQYPRIEVIANAVRQVLAHNPEAVFMIEGHTDAVGSDVDNLSLSDRRAEAVAVVLTEQFQIPPENLVTQGYGEQFRKVPTDGPSRENRRVAIRNISRLLAGR